MAKWTSTTVSLFRSAAIPARLSRGIIASAGLALAAGGWLSFDRTLHTAGWVDLASHVRSGDERVPAARIEAATERLAAVRDPGADEFGALAFLRYAAADDALVRGDRAAWQRDLADAGDAARRGLALSPARADLAVALAEIEFLRHGPGPEVYQLLDLSFRTAPRDMWIVQRRIALGLRLIAVAPPDIADHVVADIRILGAPFADPEQYRILAQAAFVAGPAAEATVERQMGMGHPWAFGAFEKYLGELRAHAAQSRAK